jgi:hypothetical protein
VEDLLRSGLPPGGRSPIDVDLTAGIVGRFEPKKITDASVAYYNLHGLIDSAEWYGQRDLSAPSNVPDYPVALGPKDLVKNGRAPEIVFSEACYGAYIEKKAEKKRFHCASWRSARTP